MMARKVPICVSEYEGKQSHVIEQSVWRSRLAEYGFHIRHDISCHSVTTCDDCCTGPLHHRRSSKSIAAMKD